MPENEQYIRVKDARAALMRYDTAVILKRFFFIEESLIRSTAGWIPATAPLLLKTAYAQMIWQDAQTADAMRRRVFELRYPSRLMSKEGEAPLIQFVDEARNAPNALAFFYSLLEVFKPALAHAYRQYLDLADAIGDGPTIRFMQLALQEKEEQMETLASFAPAMQAAHSEQEEVEARAWVAALQARLDDLGGIGLDKVEAPATGAVEPLPNRRPFAVAQVPAREEAYPRVRFYWPDIIVDGYPYGEGLKLQVRSAISHINEVWAVEACAAFTYALSPELGWGFTLDAARWTYDEARHCRMGYERLMSWGYRKEEIPLGTYIYDAAKDADPIYRLGMLFFFETKNIGKKSKRAQKFNQYRDTQSEHDMDFDWADETIHAHYGKVWLDKLLEVRGEDIEPEDVRQRCHDLVDAVVAEATDAERRQILALADNVLAKAEKLARAS